MGVYRGKKSLVIHSELLLISAGQEWLHFWCGSLLSPEKWINEMKTCHRARDYNSKGAIFQKGQKENSGGGNSILFPGCDLNLVTGNGTCPS